MIIFLDGAYGSGKTSVACELNKMLPQSIIFDPEKVGEMLANTIPFKHRKLHENTGNFQDLEVWHKLVLQTIILLHDTYDLHIILPITIINYEHLLYFKKELNKKNYKFKHFCLLASKKTIIERLEKRNEKNDWPYLQIDKCLYVFDEYDYEEYINTDNISILEICEFILNNILE